MEQGDFFAEVVRKLESLDLEYLIGGSVCSMFYGRARITQDMDVVLRLPPGHVPGFIALFPEPDHYVSDIALREALATGGQFNVLHSPSLSKVDFFTPRPDDAFANEQFARRRRRGDPRSTSTTWHRSCRCTTRTSITHGSSIGPRAWACWTSGSSPFAEAGMTRRAADTRTTNCAATRLEVAVTTTRLLIFTAVLMGCSGCLIPDVRKTVYFHVSDGETGAAIPSASASVVYEQQWLQLNKPTDRSAAADEHGVVALPVNTLGAGRYGVAAPGYVRVEVIQLAALPPGVRPDPASPRQPSYIVPLYREPAPLFVLEPPPAFQGVVTVELASIDLHAVAPMQRVMRIPVQPGGHASAAAAPLLMRSSPFHWTQPSATGAPRDPLTIPPRDEVAVRWVDTVDMPAGGRIMLFVFGTNDDALRAAHLLKDFEDPGGRNLVTLNPAKAAALADRNRAADRPLSPEEAYDFLREHGFRVHEPPR